MSPAHYAMAATLFIASVAAQSVGALHTDAPSFLAPMPVPLFFLAAVAPSGFVVAAAAGLIFTLWNPTIYTGKPDVPLRTYLLIGTTAITSALYYWQSWDAAELHQGMKYLLGCLAANISLACFSMGALYLGFAKPSPSRALMAHTSIFLWLLSFAFPYFGEGT